MGHTRYPIILSIVKWKKLERRFSDSGKAVTVDRTRLRKASINNVRIETDGWKLSGIHSTVPWCSR